MNAISLTQKQDRLLRAIGGWPQSAGVPSSAALAAALGYRAEGTIRHALKPLEACGLVARDSLSNGLIKPLHLTASGRAAIGIQETPRVLDIHNERLKEIMPVNPASCGPLAPTADEPRFFVERLADIFHGYCPGDQLLIAEGDSMTSPDGAEFSISHGDRCLIRPEIWPADGETVYVEYEREDGTRECTLKDWHCNPHSGEVTLRARNPEYSDIVREVDQVIPRGVVLEIIRKVSAPRRSTPAAAKVPPATLRPKAKLTKKKPIGLQKRAAVKSTSKNLLEK